MQRARAAAKRSRLPDAPTTTEQPTEPDADAPIPYALTDKAIAMLDRALYVPPLSEDEPVEGAVSTFCPHEKTHNGPAMPLRHGSAKTAVCDACGAYKLVTWLDKDRSGWRATDVREDVKRAQEGSVDL